MLLYHIADVHIGAKAKYLGNSLYTIQKKYLKRLYENARLDGARFVVIAGDLFDSNSIPSSIAGEIFEIFVEYPDIKTVVLPGGGSHYESEVTGHDAYTEDSIYRRPDVSVYFENDSVFLLSPEAPVLKIDDIAFYGGFFEIPAYPRENARYHIAVIHGAFGKGEGEKDPAVLESTFYDYVALGHYHAYRKFGKSAYPGAFIQFEFTRSKILESGYLKVNINEKLDIERIVFDDAPRFYRVEILDKEDVDRLRSKMRVFDFIEIEGYSEEVKDEVRRLLENENIRLRDDAYIIKKDPMLYVIHNIIREITQDKDPERQKEIETFIMRFLKKKPQKPDVEASLKRFFEL